MRSLSKKFRKIVFWTHLTVAVVIGTVVLTMAVTGMMMAFDPQIVKFAERDVRRIRVPDGDTPRLNLDSLVARAQESKGGLRAEGVQMFPDLTASIIVLFGRDHGAVFMNPYTGEALGGISKAHDFMHAVENIHRRLAAGETGQAVTGAACASFLFLLLSGLYLWWPRHWTPKTLKAVALFNAKAQGRARDWNWHNVIGLWCAPLILVTTITGLIMAYSWANDLLYAVTDSKAPVKMQKGAAGRGNTMQRDIRKTGQTNYERVYVSAAAYVPGWQSMNIRAAGTGRGQSPDAATVMVVEKEAPHGFARSQLKLDSVSGDILKWEPFSAQDSGRKLRSWIRPLHTGEAWGLTGQLMAFTSALGTVVLVWTGFAMAWRRFFIPGGSRLHYELNPAVIDSGNSHKNRISTEVMS